MSLFKHTFTEDRVNSWPKGGLDLLLLGVSGVGRVVGDIVAISLARAWRYNTSEAGGWRRRCLATAWNTPGSMGRAFLIWNTKIKCYKLLNGDSISTMMVVSWDGHSPSQFLIIGLRLARILEFEGNYTPSLETGLPLWNNCSLICRSLTTHSSSTFFCLSVSNISLGENGLSTILVHSSLYQFLVSGTLECYTSVWAYLGPKGT